MNALTRSGGTTPVLQPSTFAELVQFANMAAKSALVPRDYVGKPENIMLAVQMGSEIGLSPMQSLQNIAVIQGRPAVWGDAMPALCRASSVCEDIEETFEGEGDTLTAVCIAKRRGAKPVIVRFGVEDAKKAGLWTKQGPWQQYPRRMLQMRARSFCLRDAFPDVLKGLIAAEEAMDTPDTYTGTTIDLKPEPIPRQAVAAPIDDAIPDFDGPEYRLVSANGERSYRDAGAWIAHWKRIIEASTRTQALDKLQAGREMNAQQIADVAAHDAAAAAEVNNMLDIVLGEIVESERA